MRSEYTGRVADTHHYRVGSIELSSDIPLELPRAGEGPEGEADLRIGVEEGTPAVNHGEKIVEIDDRIYALAIEEPVIRYWRDGSIPDDAIAREILDVVLPELLSVLGKVVIHGAVIERSERAVLLTGSSGAGKSTLALALESHGWIARADDFAIINEGLRIETLGGPLRIWPDVRAAVDVKPASHSFKGKAIIDRPWRSRVRDLAAIVILSESAGEWAVVRDIEGGDAFNQLIQSCFRKAVPGDEELKRQIDTISRLVDQRTVLGIAVRRDLTRIDRAAAAVSSVLERIVS